MSEQMQEETVAALRPKSLANRRKTGYKSPPHSPETQFKPGRSGSPSGRPKLKSLTDAYPKALESRVPGDLQGRTYADFIALAMAREAVKGKVPAALEIADRVSGNRAQI